MKLYIFILAIVLVAGCVNSGPETSTGYNGVKLITNIDPQNPISEEPVTISGSLTNEGDADATNVKVEILGFSNWVGDKTWSVDNLEKTSQNTVLGIAEFIETLTAPSVPQGNNIPYNGKARLTYFYSTSANSNFRIITEDEYKLNRKTDNTEVFTETTTINTRGPVQISIEKRQPIIVDNDGIDETFIINLKNIGNGNTFYDSDIRTPNSLNIHKIKLDRVIVNGDEAICDPIILKLNSATKSSRTSCSFEMSTPPTSEFITSVQIRAEYGYLEEFDLSATVSGEDF